MRLHEHEDFAAFITATAQSYDLPEQFVEKDYWITEILRTTAETLGQRAIFKGGTSLSKGWNLLDRFSEDIDLFVNPAAEPPLRSPRAVDRALKELSRNVDDIPGLDFVRDNSKTIGGFGRMDLFQYRSYYPDLAGFPPTIRLEAGIQSGDQPTELVEISSLVGNMLAERGVAERTGVEGLEPFEMTLLHFRRTFVEKLFAIHGKVERLRLEGHLLGRDVRHYADLYVLAGRPEVTEMLSTEEYRQIREDYDEKSREFFGNSYRPPEDLRFNRSCALFPEGDARATIESAYEEECGQLFLRPHPPFQAVLERFQGIRHLL